MTGWTPAGAQDVSLYGAPAVTVSGGLLFVFWVAEELEITVVVYRWGSGRKLPHWSLSPIFRGTP